MRIGAAFACLKAASRDEADRLFRGGANTPARENEEKHHGRIGGLWFVSVQPRQSPQGDTEAPCLINCYQDDVPPTPMTPVSVEGLASLQNLIKQDAHS